MAEFTTNALSKRLNKTNKDLKNVRRQLFFYRALNVFCCCKSLRSKQMKMKLQECHLNRDSCLLFGALENRKRAMSCYRHFKSEQPSKKTFIVFSILRYQYYKRKLQKQR